MLLKPDMYPMNAETFKRYTGVDPVDDDLERVNCRCAGSVSHMSCGWNHIHNVPTYYGRSEGVFDYITYDPRGYFVCTFHIKFDIKDPYSHSKVAGMILKRRHSLDVVFSRMDYRYGMSVLVGVSIPANNYNEVAVRYIKALHDLMDSDLITDMVISDAKRAISCTTMHISDVEWS